MELITYLIAVGLPIWLVAEEVLGWKSNGGRSERKEGAVRDRARYVSGRLRDARGSGGGGGARRSRGRGGAGALRQGASRAARGPDPAGAGDRPADAGA